MTKNNSSNTPVDNTDLSEGRGTAVLKDEGARETVFIGNKSEAQTITSHFDSPPSPTDSKTTEKK